MLLIFVFQLAIFLVSVMIHEVAHGLVADKLGDPTARLAGRLTLNPIKHIDPFGSIILPLLLVFANSPFVIGWAKPVPYNPANLANPKTGAVKIAAAGPLSNILMAVVFGLLVRIAPTFGLETLTPPFVLVVYLNVLLALFNLVPIPPLDGSKFLYMLLPQNAMGYRIMAALEQFGFFILIIVIMWGFDLLAHIVGVVASFIAGTPLGI